MSSPGPSQRPAARAEQQTQTIDTIVRNILHASVPPRCPAADRAADALEPLAGVVPPQTAETVAAGPLDR